MAKFSGVLLTCVVCGVKFKVPPSRALTAKACSNECGYKVRGKTRSREKARISCECCGKVFLTYPSHAGRRFCSYSCVNKSGYRKNTRIGKDNSNWKGGISNHSRGYSYTRMKEHPFCSTGYIFEHRFIMENWLLENDPNSPFLVKMNTGTYLDPTIIVHHKNEDKKDNRIENLECMTQSQHMKHHHTKRN